MSITVALSKWGPHVRAQVSKFSQRWPTFSWGTYPGHDPSESLATDGMVPNWDGDGGKARGRAVAQAIWDERKTNGIWYVIHWGEIISITRPEKGWLPYFARNNPNPSKSHKNHVHVSWHSDSAAPTVTPVKPDVAAYANGWTPDKPWTFYLDKQADGVTKSDSVWLLQKALGAKPYDGTYSAKALRPLVAKKQASWGNSATNCDGILGPLDAAKLFGDNVTVQASAK